MSKQKTLTGNKLVDELEQILSDQRELERRRIQLWGELGQARVLAIRAGDDPGPIPLALSEHDRASQANRERIARDHAEADAMARAQGLVA